MAIAYVGVSNAAGQNNGTTTTASTVSITPTLPGGAASGDRVFVYQVGSNTSGTTPTNWNVVGTKDTTLGSGAVAAGSGVRQATWYWRDYDGVWTMPAFTLTSAAQNSHWIGAVAVRPSTGVTLNTPTITTVGGAFNTATTSYTDSSAASFTTSPGGLLLIGTGLNDNVTASAQALTQSGATFDTVTERCDGGTATGNDVSGNVATCSVVIGASATTTFTETLSAASQGETLIVQQTENAAKTDTLTDVFTTFDTATKWIGSGTATGGKLAVTAGVNASTEVDSKTFYDLTGSSFYLETSHVVASGQYYNNTWVELRIDDTVGDTYIAFLVQSYSPFKDIYFRERAGGVNSDTTITYDPVAHKWLRFRESGGTVFWDTSPDGKAWTNRRSKTAAIANTSLQVMLLTQSLNDVATSLGQTNNFDNVNVRPEAVMVNTAMSTAVHRAAFW